MVHPGAIASWNSPAPILCQPGGNVARPWWFSWSSQRKTMPTACWLNVAKSRFTCDGNDNGNNNSLWQ